MMTRRERMAAFVGLLLVLAIWAVMLVAWGSVNFAEPQGLPTLAMLPSSVLGESAVPASTSKATVPVAVAQLSYTATSTASPSETHTPSIPATATQPAASTEPAPVVIPPQPAENWVVNHFAPGTSAQDRNQVIQSIGGTITQEIDALDSVDVQVPRISAAQPPPTATFVVQSFTPAHAGQQNALLSAFSPAVSAAPGTQSFSLRIGLMSDSSTDEYRGTDNRAGGTPYAATTLNWIELLQRYRNFEVGPWGFLVRTAPDGLCLQLGQKWGSRPRSDQHRPGQRAGRTGPAGLDRRGVCLYRGQ